MENILECFYDFIVPVAVLCWDNNGTVSGSCSAWKSAKWLFWSTQQIDIAFDIDENICENNMKQILYVQKMKQIAMIILSGEVYIQQ